MEPQKLSRRDREWIDGLTQQVWDAVHLIFDGEIDVPDRIAGDAASAAEKAVREIMEREWAPPTA